MNAPLVCCTSTTVLHRSSRRNTVLYANEGTTQKMMRCGAPCNKAEIKGSSGGRQGISYIPTVGTYSSFYSNKIIISAASSLLWNLPKQAVTLQ